MMTDSLPATAHSLSKHLCIVSDVYPLTANKALRILPEMGSAVNDLSAFISSWIASGAPDVNMQLDVTRHDVGIAAVR
jgi:hypothetical protein